MDDVGRRRREEHTHAPVGGVVPPGTFRRESQKFSLHNTICPLSYDDCPLSCVTWMIHRVRPLDKIIFSYLLCNHKETKVALLSTTHCSENSSGVKFCIKHIKRERRKQKHTETARRRFPSCYRDICSIKRRVCHTTRFGFASSDDSSSYLKRDELLVDDVLVRAHLPVGHLGVAVQVAF